MSSLISISKTSEELPVAPLLVLTRTAIGLGLGILIADKIKPGVRQATAITLLALGALAAAPWLVKITAGQIDQSEWGSRARLRSIRGDSGYTLENDVY
jgi:hypothetical protein